MLKSKIWVWMNAGWRKDVILSTPPSPSDPTRPDRTSAAKRQNESFINFNTVVTEQWWRSGGINSHSRLSPFSVSHEQTNGAVFLWNASFSPPLVKFNLLCSVLYSSYPPLILSTLISFQLLSFRLSSAVLQFRCSPLQLFSQFCFYFVHISFLFVRKSTSACVSVFSFASQLHLPVFPSSFKQEFGVWWCVHAQRLTCTPFSIITIITSVCRHPLGRLICNNMHIPPFARIINSCRPLHHHQQHHHRLHQQLLAAAGGGTTSWEVNFCPDSLWDVFISFHPRRPNGEGDVWTAARKSQVTIRSVQTQ